MALDPQWCVKQMCWLDSQISLPETDGQRYGAAICPDGVTENCDSSPFVCISSGKAPNQTLLHWPVERANSFAAFQSRGHASSSPLYTHRGTPCQHRGTPHPSLKACREHPQHVPHTGTFLYLSCVNTLHMYERAHGPVLCLHKQEMEARWPVLHCKHVSSGSLLRSADDVRMHLGRRFGRSRENVWPKKGNTLTSAVVHWELWPAERGIKSAPTVSVHHWTEAHYARRTSFFPSFLSSLFPSSCSGR